MSTQEIEALIAAINGLHLQRDASQSTPTCLTTATTDLYNQLSSRLEKYVSTLGDESRPFSKWLLRHEYTLVTEAANLPPEMRTSLLLDKLGQIVCPTHGSRRIRGPY